MESFQLLERMSGTANKHSRANRGVHPKTMLLSVASIDLDAESVAVLCQSSKNIWSRSVGCFDKRRRRGNQNWHGQNRANRMDIALSHWSLWRMRSRSWGVGGGIIHLA